ncbi:MAG: ABC transporter substrate binding protein, partial [Isosphaeraceae bacterium]
MRRTGFSGDWRIHLVGLAVALAGCGEGGTTSATAPAGPVKTAVLKGTPKIALIRLNDPTTPAEPELKDVKRGLSQSGISLSDVTFVEYDAKGDHAALPSLIDAALAEGVDLLMPLGGEATLAVAAKAPKVPVVYAMAGEPMRLGLAKGNSDHDPNMTGVYSPCRLSLLVPIARGSLPKAKTFGILFNPDDPLSVAHKDALLVDGWENVEAVT